MIYEGYGPRPIPHELDDRIRTLIHSYMESDEVEQSLLSCLQPIAASVFLLFAERQASLAVRNEKMEILPSAVVSIGLAAAISNDEREGMLVMPLPWHAAQRLGVHQKHLYSSAASKVPEVGARALLSFIARRPEDQSLECMGYVEGAEPGGGFRYRRTW